MALNNNNNDKSCKCTTPEYEIVLNEQGPQGRQGEKGDAGFTPIISVKDNTASNYTLNILTQDGQITTPNLKANLPAGGATGQVLTKNSANQDDCSWQNLPNATTEVEGIARLATEADFEATEDSAVSDTSIVTPALFNTEFEKQSVNFVTTNTEQTINTEKTFLTDVTIRDNLILQNSIINNTKVDNIIPNIIKHTPTNNNIIIGETQAFTSENYKNLGIEIQCYNLDNDAGIYTHRDGNKYLLLDSSNVTAGNNITIDKTSTGITINSTGGSGGTDAYTKAETNELLDAKQDKLVAGTNITIEGNVISSTGGGEAENINLYRLEFGTTYSSPPVLFDNNAITIKAGTLVNTPNGEFTYSKDITYNYDFTTDRTIFAFKDNNQEDYYNMVDVFYGGSQPSPDSRGQVAWFDNGVWKMIAIDGIITTFETELVTPIAKVFLNSDYNIKNIDYGSYSKIPTGGGVTDVYTKTETDELLDTKVSTSDMVEVPVVVEQSDKSLMPSWYRVWSNGWIEQGGQISVTNTTTVNLLKPYTQTNYLPNTQAIGQSIGNQTNTFVSPIDTNSFSITSSASTAQDFNWYCVGY